MLLTPATEHHLLRDISLTTPTIPSQIQTVDSSTTSYRLPISPHIITSTMTSTTPNLTPLGDSKHGGALFTLPREIRDDIYRLLVKGLYLVFRHTGTEHGVSLIDSETLDKPDLIILRIAKVISREAQQVLYSESIFRYEVPFYANSIPHSSKEAVNRMKKIEIYVFKPRDVWYDPHRSEESHHKVHIPAICEAITGDFTGTEVVRDTLVIHFRSCDSRFITPLRGHVLSNLCALHGFRTIVIRISPPKSCSISPATHLPPTGRDEDTESLAQVIKDAMEATLGPATTRDDYFGFYFEFHPREHAPGLLRAQAQKLLLDADRLEQGGCANHI